MSEKPSGMTHQERDFAIIKMPHYIIKEIQEAYPELEKQMRLNLNQATNILGSFLSVVPLQIRKKLSDELRSKILNSFKVVK